ncbi:hypothetical protein Tco_0627316 [Tanacetum coccineum]|uniref:Uncharacterized protein n=1 Tax=Tanacetum coccineum TaxID=301880 RepID=A0ABQ4WM61_9ASTR
MEEMNNESKERVNLIKAKTWNEDMRMLAINTDRVDPEESKKNLRQIFFPKLLSSSGAQDLKEEVQFSEVDNASLNDVDLLFTKMLIKKLLASRILQGEKTLLYAKWIKNIFMGMTTSKVVEKVQIVSTIVP